MKTNYRITGQERIDYVGVDPTDLVGSLRSIDQKGLKRLIVLPDYCPGRGALPTGTVAVYSAGEHIPTPDLIGPDIGCGMLLAKFVGTPQEDLNTLAYSVASDLRLRRRDLGSLGSGNHFIMIYEATDSQTGDISRGDLLALIHTGSRLHGQRVFNGGLGGELYLNGHNDAVDYAAKNRRTLLGTLSEIAGVNMKILCDRPHNYVKRRGDEFIYRKGAVELLSSEFGVISSSMTGDAIVITPREELAQLENSICHGTGRVVSRSEAKQRGFDSSEVRKRVYIPHFISDDEIRTEDPACYRTIEDVESKIGDYVDVVARLSPKAFIC